MALAKPLVPMIPLALPLSVLVVFYAAKTAPDVKDQFKEIPIGWFTQFHAAPTPFKSAVLLLLFVVFEFGIYIWFVRRRFPVGTDERKLVEACGLALFCVLPLTVGYYSDLSLRACAVPLFAIAVLTMRTLFSRGLPPQMRGWFCFFVLTGSLTPVGEACLQASQIKHRNFDPRVVPHQVSAVVNMADRSFGFFGAQYAGTTNSFFLRQLAR